MSLAIDSKDVLVRMLPTPNPFALKFVLNVPLKKEGKATFHSEDECKDLPLVRDLFSIVGVRQVHVFQNTVTVTQSGDLPDSLLSDQVEAVLKSRVPIHNPDFKTEDTKVKPVRPASSDPVIAQIEEILDRTVRPGLQADGGDIEIVEFTNDELRIVYQGACGGCPSAMMGTLDAIQGILRSELANEKITVIPVEP